MRIVVTPRTSRTSLRAAIATTVVAAVLLAPGLVRRSPAAGPCESPATIILVVRHADRAGTADSLSAAGLERARELARVANHAGTTAIYHSDTRRTRDTATPLAQALHITPEEYSAKEVKALIERILRDHAGETVVVVGHSNTVPLIIEAAGGPHIPEIDEKEFDGLFVLAIPRCGGPARLTALQYGAPSP